MSVSIEGEYTNDAQTLPGEAAQPAHVAQTASAGPAPTEPRRVQILGTHVCTSTFVESQDYLASLVRRRVGGYLTFATAFSVTKALDDLAYQDIINGASYVAADGMSIVWALRCLGARAERVHGDDFFLSCCQRFRGWRHFLVGGREGQAQAAAVELRRRFPLIDVCGTWATPTRPVAPLESARIVRQIRQLKPSVVWVGMGTPAQDQWMAAAVARARVPMVGVGSLFDILSGRTRPAPAWVKRSGLQWCFRMVQEPRRLAFRYLYYNPRFVAALSRQLAQRALGFIARPQKAHD